MSIVYDDIFFMQKAIEQAQLAYGIGEVPVGAVIVENNIIIASGFNSPISNNDCTAHAEIVALRNAGEKKLNYRLNDCKLYVTIEPCVMCYGAIVHSRISEVIFGAFEKKAGVCVSNDFDNKFLNHKFLIKSGVLEGKCSDLMRSFFKSKRMQKKN